MDALLTAAASGLRSRAESLDLLSNNIANGGTAGFKADRGAYRNYFSAAAMEGTQGSHAMLVPSLEGKWTDYSQGTLIETGNALDIALSGSGFFVLQRGNEKVYARNGSFGLSAQGELITKAGHQVLDAESRPIRLDTSKGFVVERDGAIRQGESIVAKLAVVDVPDTNALSKLGNTYFTYNRADLPTTAKAEVHQGKLESANFSPVESAIGLVQVMRQFEMLQRAVTLGSELNRRAIEEVGKS